MIVLNYINERQEKIMESFRCFFVMLCPIEKVAPLAHVAPLIAERMFVYQGFVIPKFKLVFVLPILF
jgi:hypothetical protein